MSDSSARQLLVVEPNRRLALTDEALDSIIYSSLGVETPTNSLTRAFWQNIGLAGVVGSLAAYGAPKFYQIQESIGPLRQLLRALVAERPEALMPELGIYGENHQDLALLRSVDGCFFTGVVYAAHPGDRNYFIRLADFHHYLEQDKRAEFLLLASSLGAKSLRMLDADGHSQSGSLDGKVESTHVGVKAGAGAGTRQSFHVAAEFQATNASPCLPSSLRWLGLEPLWAAMAEARINHGALSYRTAFEYSRDYNVTAELCAKIQAIGFTAGGKFQGLHTVRQEYEIEFFPHPKKRSAKT